MSDNNFKNKNILHPFKAIPDVFLTDEFLEDPIMMKVIRYAFNRISYKKHTETFLNNRTKITIELQPYEFIFGRKSCVLECNASSDKVIRTRIDRLRASSYLIEKDLYILPSGHLSSAKASSQASSSKPKRASTFTVYALSPEAIIKNRGQQFQAKKGQQLFDEKKTSGIDSNDISLVGPAVRPQTRRRSLLHSGEVSSLEIDLDTATPTPSMNKRGKAAAAALTNEEKEAAKALQAYLRDRCHLENWGDQWSIPENVFKAMIIKYDLSYVTEQINFMISKQTKYSKEQQKQYPNKKVTGIDSPEGFFKSSCEKNFAASISERK